MSSQIQKEITKRVWKDKLDFFFSQPLDQFYDSLENYETDITDKWPTYSKTSRFMKFFKTEDNQENERTSASGGDNSEDTEEDFTRNKKKCKSSSAETIKITNLLKNGWDFTINKQKSLNVKQILQFKSVRMNVSSKLPGIPRDLKKNKFKFKFRRCEVRSNFSGAEQF